MCYPPMAYVTMKSMKVTVFFLHLESPRRVSFSYINNLDGAPRPITFILLNKISYVITITRFK